MERRSWLYVEMHRHEDHDGMAITVCTWWYLNRKAMKDSAMMMFLFLQGAVKKSFLQEGYVPSYENALFLYTLL